MRRELIEQYPEYEEELSQFQFRDLRAKTATDIYLNETLTSAKEQLGHTSENMTRTYIRKPKTKAPIQHTPKDAEK